MIKFKGGVVIRVNGVYVSRRNEGQYRETDRVTHLLNWLSPGKHWLRARRRRILVFQGA